MANYPPCEGKPLTLARLHSANPLYVSPARRQRQQAPARKSL
jgi:hypothetical protein